MKKVYTCLTYLALLSLGLLSTTMAAPPNATNGTADVDGVHGEWNLGADHFADMYRAGKSDKPVESKLYLRYDCSAQVMYVLVVTVDGVVALQQPNDAYVKFGNSDTKVNGNSGDDGTAPDFQWLFINGVLRGYEASFPMAAGSVNNLNVHLQVDDGGSQTSAVSDRAITCNAICPLPVNLSLFTARNEENAVRLFWQSASEDAFEAYLIERSPDARQFATIGRVEGRGRQKGLTNYSFVDAEMPADATTLYYRLKMLDKDGTFAYSKIEAVQRKITTLQLNLQANPVRDALRFQVLSPVAQTVQVTLMDNRGQERLRRSTTVSEGQTPVELGIPRLPTGIYWLIVSDGLVRRSHRLLIE